MYESIVKGENILEPGLPEAFNVLIKELQALALNVELMESDILTDEMEDEGGDDSDEGLLPTPPAGGNSGSGEGQAH